MLYRRFASCKLTIKLVDVTPASFLSGLSWRHPVLVSQVNCCMKLVGKVLCYVISYNTVIVDSNVFKLYLVHITNVNSKVERL